MKPSNIPTFECRGPVPLLEGQEWLPWEVHVCWIDRCQRWKYLTRDDAVLRKDTVLKAARDHNVPSSVRILGISTEDQFLHVVGDTPTSLTRWGNWPVILTGMILASILLFLAK